MTQLIINGTEYPEISRDKYKCFPEDKGESFRMADGTLVTEVSYTVMAIEYSYDYFPDALLRQCLTDLRGSADLDVRYLAPGESAMRSGRFRCVKKPAPTYAFSVGGVPYWRDISFRLEGVEGVD